VLRVFDLAEHLRHSPEQQLKAQEDGGKDRGKARSRTLECEVVAGLGKELRGGGKVRTLRRPQEASSDPTDGAAEDSNRGQQIWAADGEQCEGQRDDVDAVGEGRDNDRQARAEQCEQRGRGKEGSQRVRDIESAALISTFVSEDYDGEVEDRAHAAVVQRKED
jgi:hypothetical protein